MDMTDKLNACEQQMRLHRRNLEGFLDQETLAVSTASRGLALARKELDAYVTAEGELRREMDALRRENQCLRNTGVGFGDAMAALQRVENVAQGTASEAAIGAEYLEHQRVFMTALASWSGAERKAQRTQRMSDGGDDREAWDDLEAQASVL